MTAIFEQQVASSPTTNTTFSFAAVQGAAQFPLPDLDSGSVTSTDATLSFEPVQGAAQFALAGPPGPAGGSGSAQVFEFDTASSEWVCSHNLGRLPQVTAYDLSGNSRPFIPISNPDLNTTVLTPTPPLAGKVVIS